MNEKFNRTDVKKPLANGEKRIASVEVEWIDDDDDADLSFLDQHENADNAEEQGYYLLDQARKRLYGDDWNMQGCRAKAHCLVGIGEGSARIQVFTSGGLWGIESDSDDDFRKSIEAGELADLKQYLAGFGFNVEDFDSLVG